MDLKEFRITNFRCIQDSEIINVDPLTVFVGKNESGKTALLKALHKLNPFKEDPYDIDNEWPRGFRKDRDAKSIVCKAKFELSEEEINKINKKYNIKYQGNQIEISKDYLNQFHINFLENTLNDNMSDSEIKEMCSILDSITEPVNQEFKKNIESIKKEIIESIKNGNTEEIIEVYEDYYDRLQSSKTSGNPQPQHNNENKYLTNFENNINQIIEDYENRETETGKLEKYIIDIMPTFIFMSDYRVFQGTADLSEIYNRKMHGKLDDEDKTLITILELSGLDLEGEIEKINEEDKEQRQYDLADASSTLTREISERWKQRKYEVQFRADGNYFFTFVKDEMDPSLIKLEERSKGFQWFFSFDLMFMYESKGTFENCVILLDEPGLHLHPGAQKDLLERLNEYAKGNTLLYTTHLPFMINLQKPERIRVINESKKGTVVNEDLTNTNPEAKLVLQAALGMSGCQSYLVSQKNLVVEGVDDYWIINEISRLMERSDKPSIPIEIFITPAGGASEVVYMTTFMVGQRLNVIALLDNDQAGRDAKEKLIKKWLTKYHDVKARVILLNEVIEKDTDFTIEDIFEEEWYIERVEKAYNEELKLKSIKSVKLKKGKTLIARITTFFNDNDLKYNKGRVAKIIIRDLSKMKSIEDIPEEMKIKFIKLIELIRNNLA